MLLERARQELRDVTIPLGVHAAVKLVRHYLFAPAEEISPEEANETGNLVRSVFARVRSQGEQPYRSFLAMVNDRGVPEQVYTGLRPDAAASHQLCELADPRELRYWMEERMQAGSADFSILNAQNYLHGLPYPQPSRLARVGRLADEAVRAGVRKVFAI